MLQSFYSHPNSKLLHQHLDKRDVSHSRITSRVLTELTTGADGCHIATTLVHRKPDSTREFWLNATFIAIEGVKEHDATTFTGLLNFLRQRVSQKFPWPNSRSNTYPEYPIA